MTKADTCTPPTVHFLRQRWLPHKERFQQERNGHPTAVRFHRACSWLDEAEKLDGDEQADHVLILQWTALNALYGQWDMDRREPLADRPSWQAFLARMSDLDVDGRLVSLLKDNRGLVLAILGNGYLNRYFWQDPDSMHAGKSGRIGRRKAESWYAEQAWGIVLEQVVERIYLLRCQLVHGAATLRSRLNRTALKHCTTMMRLLLPTLLLIWIDHGADEDWGIMCYPPVDDKPSSHERSTWRPKHPR